MIPKLLFVLFLSGLTMRCAPKPVPPTDNTPSFVDPVLTPSYGLITREDIAEEDRAALRIPLVLGETSSYNFWQCYPRNEIDFWCAKDGAEDAETGRTSEAFFLSIFHDHHYMVFAPRRYYTPSVCEEVMITWETLMMGVDIVCINGAYTDEETLWDEWAPAPRDTTRASLWQINRVKTRRGDWYYFESV